MSLLFLFTLLTIASSTTATTTTTTTTITTTTILLQNYKPTQIITTMKLANKRLVVIFLSGCALGGGAEG